MNERREKENYSTFLYYLPFRTDHKEGINQWCDNVNLTPVDVKISDIEEYSSKKVKFGPLLLNSRGQERLDQVIMLYAFFRQIAHNSNQNLCRNVDNLNLREKRDASKMEWSVASKKPFDISKYKSSY